MKDASGREIFEECHFVEWFGGYEDDFDLDAIRSEVTEYDPRSGRTYWKKGADLTEIAKRHDISAK